ncbi:uncharacterized protein LOC117121215 [Anneissia japonica]|uniref:uncharacterized protein LOC117121215 n=1 Tax=Anneissia japonica TaxID=1529436 RepID=UPI001425848B|nr:uncharacterized protein LOC117121215 [Anneissia japonica]
MDDFIKNAIQSVLPSLNEDLLMAVVERLNGHGVETEEDLQFVTEDDVKDLLKTIQPRKLLSSWNKNDPFASVMPIIPIDLPSLSPSTSSERSSSDDSQAVPSIVSPNNSFMNWPDVIDIPFDKFPHGLKNALRSGNRPSPAERRHMVRMVVDVMRTFKPNPNKAQCASVAKAIVVQYSDSFIDKTDDGEKLGCGYYSLLMKIKTRVEHVNRNNDAARMRKKKKNNNKEVAAANEQPAVDSYGCINWQPNKLPPGETDETLQFKKGELIDHYEQFGPTQSDNENIEQLMSDTCILQRKMLNSRNPSPTIPELRKNWPYLFVERGLFAQFHKLTGIPIHMRLREARLKKGMRII